VNDQLHVPAALTRERVAGMHGIEGWVDPRGGLDVSERRKIYFSFRESNPRSSSKWPDPYTA